MSIAAQLFATLGPLVAGRVYPAVAPEASSLPRIVYQQVGGKSINYVDDTLPDKRNGRMQVACWAMTDGQAEDLILQVEALLLSAPALQVESLGAPSGAYEEDTKLYAYRQDFSVWAAR